MLVPLRDYLCPKDPLSSPLLNSTKDYYFTRLSVNPDPSAPGFKETEWITSEDANVEHLLNVFMSIDQDADCVWDACVGFIRHLYWHKQRRTVLGSRIEALPDDHRFKPECLLALGVLLGMVGNHLERKRLLIHTLKLQREGGDDIAIATTLAELSQTNRMLHLYKEGIDQAKEALEIYERADNKRGQGDSLIKLACLLRGDGQLDAAEEAVYRAIEALPEKGEEHRVCESHRTLGEIYHSKGEREKAIRHFETALGSASAFGWNEELCWSHYGLAKLFRAGGELDDAHAHIERAKSYSVDSMYQLGRVALLQAEIYHQQLRLEDATSEASRALVILEKIGALVAAENCRAFLQTIEREKGSYVGLVSLWAQYCILHPGLTPPSQGTPPDTSANTLDAAHVSE